MIHAKGLNLFILFNGLQPWIAYLSLCIREMSIYSAGYRSGVSSAMLIFTAEKWQKDIAYDPPGDAAEAHQGHEQDHQDDQDNRSFIAFECCFLDL